MIARTALALLLIAAAPAWAQADPLAEAEAAYQAGQYAQAVEAATRAVQARPDDAEAHYLLGRILYDEANPLRDEGEASDAIDRAVDLAPDNVLYLVARLETLRRESWSYLIDLLRARQRASLARRILAVDPDNAFAHEELGVQGIRDFYQYRNAIALPNLAFASSSRAASAPVNEEPDRVRGGPGPVGGPGNTGDQDETLSEESLSGNFYIPGADRIPGALGRRDRVAAVLRDGVPSVSFEARAESARAEAESHLRRALASDPRRRSVYDHVLRLAVLSDDYAGALPAVQEMLVQFDADPYAWLYAGLVYHRLGEYEGAENAFRNALERLGPDARAVFEDLTLILPPDEWAAFRADPDVFARRYWTSRDPRFLNQANERRSEHYARLTAADLLFESDDLNLPGWKTKRGELYVRYGPPSQDLMIDGSFQAVLEQFADRDPSFEPNAFADNNRFNVWDYGDFLFVFEDPGRTGEFRLYAPPADLYGLASATGVDRMDYEAQARDRVRRTPERYAFQSPGRAIELPYRVTAFKGEEGDTDLYVAYGVPIAGEAEPGPTSDVDVTIRTGAFLIDDRRDLVLERRRTVFGLRGAQIVGFDQTRLWTSAEPMRSRPGAHEVSLEFETISGGTSAVQRRDVEVPDFSSEALQLSDVLLAYAIDESDTASPGRILRNGLSIQPAPWAVFGSDDPVFLYVEVYGLGLAGGQSNYEVEARLVPKDTSSGLGRVARRLLGRRARGVSTAFESQGSTADDWQNLIVDAAGQPPGLYTLTVSVRDRVSGRTAERTTDLFLE